MADYTLNQVNDMYVDVLKEIGNIGAECNNCNGKYVEYPD